MSNHILLYIKDNSDFTNKINEREDINKDINFVKLDAKSFYTNILNHEGIKVVKSTLNSISQKPIATKVIVRFLFLMLTLNNLAFNRIHYLQKTICAPNHANISMEKFEKT